MEARRWIWLTALLLLLIAAVVGCAKDGEQPDAGFAEIALDAAPAELQGYYDETKAVPGLYALQKDGQTYLLLLAGTAAQPGMSVRVLDLRQAGNGWRLLAAMEYGNDGITYPYAVLKLKASADADFKARLTGPSGEVLELRAMKVTDR
jgi:hypothetical protein